MANASVVSLPQETRPVPGPRFRTPFGFLSVMRRDPVGFVMRCAREYGDVVHVRLSPWSMFLFAHPRDVRHILQDHHKNYWKGPFLGKLKRIAGEGLVFSDGDAEPVLTLRPRPSLLMTIHRRG